ncbi:MAG TPA: ROK family protein [Terriglobales bacterium]|nr:ROK family protein [Terriglobales bacterium]
MIGAVDIGGTKIAAGVVAADGRILARGECATNPTQGFENGMQRIIELLHECERSAGEKLKGIGVGSTGPIDPRTGIFGTVDNLPGWKGSNLKQPLEREFGVPVAIENDADAAALGEACWGAGWGKNRFIYITISTGIGGGLVFDGELYRGVNDSHPELGHMVVEASGPVCYCGARGCWEWMAAGPAMVTWMRENAPAGAKLPEDLSAKEICRLAEQGDALAGKAVEREGYYLGVGLANLVTMYCPDAIALGGGVMGSAHLFLDRAREVVRTSCTLVPADKTEILLACMGADAGVAGAARAWYNRFEKQKKS